MAQCPYSEYVTDETDNKVYANPLHSAWHQGYEARKLETMKGDIAKQKDLDRKMKQVDKFAAQFISRTEELNKLHAELMQQKVKLGTTKKRE
jgi:putative heme iron utilization protein